MKYFTCSSLQGEGQERLGETLAGVEINSWLQSGLLGVCRHGTTGQSGQLPSSETQESDSWGFGVRKQF